MEALSTYSHLFRNYREVLRMYSSPLMDACRDEAFARFEQRGFPSTQQEAYRLCDLSEALGIDYGMNLYRLSVPAHPGDVFRCDVPTLATRLFFVVNDVYYPSKKQLQWPQGVLCGSLSELTRQHPALLERFYNRLAQESQDGLAAMNTAFAQDGYLLYVPDNVHIDRPLQLIQLFQGEIDILANRRLLIVLGKNARVQLMVCDHAISYNRYFSNQVTEIFLDEQAHLEFYEMEMTHDNTNRVSNTFISQQSGSSLLMNSIGLENGLTRNNVYLRFEGKGAEANLSGLSLLSRSQAAHNHVVVDHAVGNCRSNQLFKYVLDDSSHGVFGGKVLVEKGADQTVALQSNANMCNTSKARMNAMPQLEIYADDVQCSHGSATGQIDENALFYMRQRGLSQDEAKQLLKYAFVGDVVERIQLSPLQDRIKVLIGKRFRGELSKCAECNICP